MAFLTGLIGISKRIRKALVVDEAISRGHRIAGVSGFFAKGGGAFEVVFFARISRGNANASGTNFWAVAKIAVV